MQRRGDQRAQAAAGEPLRERVRRAIELVLVHQGPGDGTGQAILVNRDRRRLGHRQLERQRLTLGSDPHHDQCLLHLIVEAHAAEIEREVILQASHHDLEDAGQVLALADRPGDPVEQTETGQLGLQTLLTLLPFADVAHECTERRRTTHVNRGDRDFDRELVPAATHGSKLEATVEDARLAGFEITRQAGAVRVAQRLRDDHVREDPADHLLSRPTEHLSRPALTTR